MGKLGRFRKLHLTYRIKVQGSSRHEVTTHPTSPPLRGSCCRLVLVSHVLKSARLFLFPSQLQDCSSSFHNMTSDLFIVLKAPNGREYKQPVGLFINNEFVKSKSEEKITSINPT